MLDIVSLFSIVILDYLVTRIRLLSFSSMVALHISIIRFDTSTYAHIHTSTHPYTFLMWKEDGGRSIQPVVERLGEMDE